MIRRIQECGLADSTTGNCGEQLRSQYRLSCLQDPDRTTQVIRLVQCIYPVASDVNDWSVQLLQLQADSTPASQSAKTLARNGSLSIRICQWWSLTLDSSNPRAVHARKQHFRPRIGPNLDIKRTAGRKWCVSYSIAQMWRSPCLEVAKAYRVSRCCSALRPHPSCLI